MLKFKFKVNQKKTAISWTAAWDGKHDESWYSADEHTPHPFSGTGEFQTDYDLLVRMKEAFKRTGKRKIRFADLRNLDGTLKRPTKAKWLKVPKRNGKGSTSVPWVDTLVFTSADLEKLDPLNQREIGDVCSYNPVTLALCKMLSDKENVSRHSGWTDRYWYWVSLLGCLAKLWD